MEGLTQGRAGSRRQDEAMTQRQSLGRERILVVDDVPTVRLSLRQGTGDAHRTEEAQPRAGGTACPTSENAGLVVVAQAVPPA